ncbi:MAG: trimethylamine methyltransferase family protein [Hadesarchaea archaeon]|nr:trimethylamine methyltransferase family protein [Hadesarchaea archaeon]
MVGLKGGQLEILSQDEVYKIHQKTMEVLENVGVKVLEPNAFKILKDGGAEIDPKTNRVYLPEHMVKEALKKAPGEFTLHARNPKYDVKIEKKRVYFGPMIGRIYILDLETGKRRLTNLKDVENLCKVVDAMETYRLIHGGAVMPNIDGVPGRVTHVLGYIASVKNTSKVVKATARGTQRAKDCLKMAAILAGGEEELRKKPMIYTTVNPISPLQHATDMTEGLLEYAKMGQPVDFGVEIQAGATGPVTLAGVLVQQGAEILSGVTIAQLVNPGTPVFYGTCSTIMDMKRGHIALGAIEAGILNVASAQMARYYNLPCRGTAGDTESKLIDVQNGYERALNLLLASLAGVNYIFYPGTLESARTISLEQLVIDDEICGMIYRVLKGIKVDEETLAYDVIAKVGPGGHYLDQMHTLKYLMEEQYFPKISDRETRENWEKAGSKDLWQVAREKVREILKKHEPDPLDKEVEKQLIEYAKEVEKRESKG